MMSKYDLFFGILNDSVICGDQTAVVHCNIVEYVLYNYSVLLLFRSRVAWYYHT